MLQGFILYWLVQIEAGPLLGLVVCLHWAPGKKKIMTTYLKAALRFGNGAVRLGIILSFVCVILLIVLMLFLQVWSLENLEYSWAWISASSHTANLLLAGHCYISARMAFNRECSLLLLYNFSHLFISFTYLIYIREISDSLSFFHIFFSGISWRLQGKYRPTWLSLTSSQKVVKSLIWALLNNKNMYSLVPASMYHPYDAQESSRQN